jgi:hypothetical protein
MKLFQYALIKHPTEKEKGDGKKSELLKSKQGFLITHCLADDLERAKLLAARDIPDDFIANLDQLEIAVRPF